MPEELRRGCPHPPSRRAAKESSPARKPWVSGKTIRVPEGRQKRNETTIHANRIRNRTRRGHRDGHRGGARFRRRMARDWHCDRSNDWLDDGARKNRFPTRAPWARELGMMGREISTPRKAARPGAPHVVSLRFPPYERRVGRGTLSLLVGVLF